MSLSLNVFGKLFEAIMKSMFVNMRKRALGIIQMKSFERFVDTNVESDLEHYKLTAHKESF